ncbi:MAG: A24 family peptidase C-terminal domain-containing protein [Candidatus Bathyarchaeia archaeon]
MFNLNVLEALNLIGFASSLVFLGYAAYRDLKIREVSDILWLIYGPTGLILSAARLLYDQGLWRIHIASILSMSAVASSMAYLGLFGGADAKAFICLSIANPVWPRSSTVLGWIHPIYPLAVLYNTYLLTAAAVIYALARNIHYRLRGGSFFTGFEEAPVRSKIVALLTGYKVSLRDLEGKYLYPIEGIRDGGRRFSLLVDAEADREALIEELKEEYEARGVEEAWATPGLPLLAYVIPALIATGLLGDVFARIVVSIIGRI